MKRCNRCLWSDEYILYHDDERGEPVYDDCILFEFLVLEWAQAWLSWSTILHKRAWYKKAFKNFDPILCSKLSDAYLDWLKNDASIVRHKLKIYSVRNNANVFIHIQEEFWSFSNYLRSRVDNKQVVNHRTTLDQCPAFTPLSETISKDLKKRGMKFIGWTIMYAYLQAVWVVDDHVLDCWKRKKSS